VSNSNFGSSGESLVYILARQGRRNLSLYVWISIGYNACFKPAFSCEMSSAASIIKADAVWSDQLASSLSQALPFALKAKNSLKVYLLLENITCCQELNKDENFGFSKSTIFSSSSHTLNFPFLLQPAIFLNKTNNYIGLYS